MTWTKQGNTDFNKKPSKVFVFHIWPNQLTFKVSNQLTFKISWEKTCYLSSNIFIYHNFNACGMLKMIVISVLRKFQLPKQKPTPAQSWERGLYTLGGFTSMAEFPGLGPLFILYPWTEKSWILLLCLLRVAGVDESFYLIPNMSFPIIYWVHNHKKMKQKHSYFLSHNCVYFELISHTDICLALILILLIRHLCKSVLCKTMPYCTLKTNECVLEASNNLG